MNKIMEAERAFRERALDMLAQEGPEYLRPDDLVRYFSDAPDTDHAARVFEDVLRGYWEAGHNKDEVDAGLEAASRAHLDVLLARAGLDPEQFYGEGCEESAVRFNLEPGSTSRWRVELRREGVICFGLPTGHAAAVINALVSTTPSVPF